ncbi:MAG: hypothetical protein JNL88_03410 [Bacteroidia bacterium]|nr:hypothetical protein [Bacteroidia bacterium]
MRKAALSGMLSLLFLFSCSEQKEGNRNLYFSSALCMQNEIRHLQEGDFFLLKEITYKGKKELIQVNKPDWEKELKPFVDADISLPGLTHAYEVDSALIADTSSGKTVRCTVRHYTAKEKKTAVQKLSVWQWENGNTRLSVELKKSNSWFSLEQRMDYTSGTGYTITGKQKMTIGDPAGYNISARFMKNNSTP